jgi:lipopolysaccharide biosynthesis regulator YciM
VIDWLLLLLPVAAASGWWAAKRSLARSSGGVGAPDPAYFHGLNYLLDDQPDKAIDIFVKLAEVDSEAAEIHLALGGLFRRRGEVDRAIRVHQSLVARPRIDKQLRSFALHELGQDYMRAGLFDRAESLFNELLEIKAHRRRALEGLLEIYQQEKEWRKCMDVARRLQDLTGIPMGNEIAQYHCELAEEALKGGDEELAERFLRDAQSADAACVRATMLQARMAMGRGDRERAAELYRSVSRQGQRFRPEVVGGLLDAYRDRPTVELLDELRSLYEEQPTEPLVLALADALEKEEGAAAAVALLKDYVGKYADLAALERLLDLYGAGALDAEDEAISVNRAVRRVVHHLHSREVRYQCENCGFVARKLHWQCPSCRYWGSIQPTQPPMIDAD